MNVLDILAHNDAALAKYRLCYDEWKQTDRELAELVSLAEKSRSDEDYIRFQLEQLRRSLFGGRRTGRTGAGSLKH